MNTKTFVDLRTAANYLAHSVVRVGSCPVYIRAVESAGDRESWKIFYKKLGSMDLEMTFMPSGNINLNPVPLGLFNTETSIGKAARAPSRSWKIGLSYSNMSLHWGNNNEEITMENFLISDYLKNLITNHYPIYEDAITEVSEGGVSTRAFSRKFAVNEAGEIIYSRTMCKVGSYESEGGYPSLMENYRHLREALEEDIR